MMSFQRRVLQQQIRRQQQNQWVAVQSPSLPNCVAQQQQQPARTIVTSSSSDARIPNDTSFQHYTTSFNSESKRSVLQQSMMLSTSSNMITKSTASSLPPSEAAVVNDTVTAQAPQKKRSTTLSTKNPIIVTDRAAVRINELLEQQDDDSVIGLKLGVKRRGCNGLSYVLKYAHVADGKKIPKSKQDIVMKSSQGITIQIEPMALFNIVGTEMDWIDTELTSEFTFTNPNSKGSCGCGESFNV